MKEHLQPGISEMVSISEDDLTSDCGSIADAFAQVVNDITGGNVPVDIALPLKIENAYSNNALPVVFLSFQTFRSWQIVQTQIRLSWVFIVCINISIIWWYYRVVNRLFSDL